MVHRVPYAESAAVKEKTTPPKASPQNFAASVETPKASAFAIRVPASAPVVPGGKIHRVDPKIAS
jgi:hypothetical protein